MPPVFARRAGRPSPPEDLRRAFGSFGATLADVEAAKATLVSVVPSGRVPGVPLAQALDGFELGLEAAAASMPGWRQPQVEEAWTACEAGLAAGARAAARLRRSEPPTAYEALMGALEALLDPLDAFDDAVERFAGLGLSTS